VQGRAFLLKSSFCILESKKGVNAITKRLVHFAILLSLLCIPLLNLHASESPISIGEKSIGLSGAEAAGNEASLAIRSDIALSGGRSGAGVKNLTGPASSVLKGSEGRIFITNESGQVVWDVTAARAKPVIPGKGFGPYEYGDVPNNFLELITKVWGGK
jgi:hypothetical protein